MIGRLAAAENDELIARTEGLGSDAHRAALDTQRKLTLEVEQLLLSLLKINHPELEKWPFGAKGFQHVLGTVLAKLGFGDFEPDVPARRQPKMTTVKKKPRKSRRP